MQDRTPTRTVVVGAGFAGTLAARVCSAAGHDVTVVESDAQLSLPRPGVPQAQQLHNVLGRAQRHLIELVPDVRARFDAAGGCRASVSSQTRVFELGQVMPERDLGLEIWSAPRYVVDAVVQDGLGDLVRFRTGSRFENLVVEDDRVVGVLVQGERLDADLVVDAMGARSPIPRLLGAQAPEVVEHRVGHWYSTVQAELPDAEPGTFWLTFPTAPRTRGGLASPTSAGLWNVSLTGGGLDLPPTSTSEFVAYAGTLEHLDLARLLGSGRAKSQPRTFRKPAARWRRYDRRPTAGLVSIGDAVADLDPLFGQGLSVAAWQASALADVLSESLDAAQFAQTYAERAAEVVQAAWDLMFVFEDSASPLDPGSWDRLAAAITTDPEAHRRYVEVWHLLRPVAEFSDLRAATGKGKETA